MPYLTPEDVPSERDCRALLIPASSDWLAIFSGALTELTKDWNWEQQGITVAEALTVVNNVIQGYYDGCVNSGCTLPDGQGIFRLDENGNVEQLVNGEWVRPIGDATIPAVPARTEPTPEERRCLAAANAALVLEEVYETITDSFNEDQTLEEMLTAVLAGLAARFFWLAPIASGMLLLALAAMGIIYALAELFLVDLWDSDFTDAIRCMLYECAEDSGDVVTFDYKCFQEKLQGELDVVDLDAIQLRLLVQMGFILNNIGGVDALNHAGALTAITSADCDECDQEWCYVLDLALDDGGWTPFGTGQGHWQSGVGIVADNVVVGVERTILQGTFPFSGTVTGVHTIAVNYNYFSGNVQGGVTGFGGSINDFAEGWADIDMTAMVDGTNQLLEVHGEWDMFNLFIDIQASHNGYGGSAAALVVTLRGSGDIPTFLEADGWVACEP